jgi:hypothetical protein
MTTGKKNVVHVVVVVEQRGRRSWYVLGWKEKNTRILSTAISPMPVQQTVSAFVPNISKLLAHNNKMIFHKDDSAPAGLE